MTHNEKKMFLEMINDAIIIFFLYFKVLEKYIIINEFKLY